MSPLDVSLHSTHLQLGVKMYSYFTRGRDFKSNAEAKTYLLEVYGDRIVSWTDKTYDKCTWHGDSTIALDTNGYTVCEIECHMYGYFCNPPDGVECGYHEH